jgi:hypothetical protein
MAISICKDRSEAERNTVLQTLLDKYERGIYEPVDGTSDINVDTEWQLTEYGKQLAREAEERDDPVDATGIEVNSLSGQEIAKIATDATSEDVKPNRREYYRQLSEAITSAIERGDYTHDEATDEYQFQNCVV